MTKKIAIISARMASTRLKGKSLMPIEGKSMFAHQIERIKQIKGIDEIWLATSANAENEPLLQEAKNLGILHFSGDENSILSRFYAIIQQSNPDYIARFCGDNPLIDFKTAEKQLEAIAKHNLDYLCVKGLNIQLGMVECFSKKALISQYQNLDRNDLMRQESIGLWVKENSKLFKLGSIAAMPQIHQVKYRLTVDFPEDYELVCKIYKDLHKGHVIDFKDVINFLNQNPNIAQINQNCVMNLSSNLWESLNQDIPCFET